jgi:hypothetical protein
MTSVACVITFDAAVAPNGDIERGGLSADQLRMLAFELAIYVSVRCGVDESAVEARVSEAERVAIISEELTSRSIGDARNPLARSQAVFDSAADRVEAMLMARAA